jgi:hypothetical protein
MSAHYGTCPLTQRQLVDIYFMEYRTKILDIAAFLDRMDRSVDQNAENDFRVVAFRQALSKLCSEEPERVEKIQMVISDQTVEPVKTTMMPQFQAHMLWGGDRTPQFPDDGTMPEWHTYFPPIGGFRFGMFTVMPDSTGAPSPSATAPTRR